MIALIVAAIFPAWLFMLLCGALYHEFGWLAPIGFLPAFGISVLLALLFGGAKR